MRIRIGNLQTQYMNWRRPVNQSKYYLIKFYIGKYLTYCQCTFFNYFNQISLISNWYINNNLLQIWNFISFIWCTSTFFYFRQNVTAVVAPSYVHWWDKKSACAISTPCTVQIIGCLAQCMSGAEKSLTNYWMGYFYPGNRSPWTLNVLSFANKNKIIEELRFCPQLCLRVPKFNLASSFFLGYNFYGSQSVKI